MWQKLSLRMRLIALFALVLILGLAINIGRLLLEAGPRVQAEDESVIRLAREFIEASVGRSQGQRGPRGQAGCDRRRAAKAASRHGDARGRSAASPGKNWPGQRRRTGGPVRRRHGSSLWFVRSRPPKACRLSSQGKSLGSLVIASHPTDEIAEIWDGIVTQVEIGSALAVALFLVTIVVVSRALAPIQSLADAMASIEAGRYDTRVVPTGSAEIADICDKLNHLANALGNAVEEKQHLAERVVSLQDVERKEIARELHDEFGPYLFALRAHATSLMRVADIAKPDIDGVRRHGNAMLDQVNALQQFNRRVLEKLRPAGLSELGLNEALGALVRLWRDAHPGVVVETGVSQSLGDMGETAELTIYRIVQEALTNVFRHSGATHVYRDDRTGAEILGQRRAGRSGARARSGQRGGPAIRSQIRSRPDRNARARDGAGRHDDGGVDRGRLDGRGCGPSRRPFVRQFPRRL